MNLILSFSLNVYVYNTLLPPQQEYITKYSQPFWLKGCLVIVVLATLLTTLSIFDPIKNVKWNVNAVTPN